MEIKKVRTLEAMNKIKEMLLINHPHPVLKGNYFVMVDEGKIKGTICLLKRSWYLSEIRHLIVKPEYRGAGLGQRLVDEVLNKVKTPVVCCTIHDDNPVSKHLFQKKEFATFKQLFNPITQHNVILMLK